MDSEPLAIEFRDPHDPAERVGNLRWNKEGRRRARSRGGKRRHLRSSVRNRVLSRDNKRCLMCGMKASNVFRLTHDESVDPVSAHVSLCETCREDVERGYDRQRRRHCDMCRIIARYVPWVRVLPNGHVIISTD